MIETLQPVIPETDEVFVVPASFAQQRLWFLEHLSPGLASYNVPLALRLRGPLDADRLERALNAVVARHEVLRSALGQEEDEAVQLISPALEIPLRRRAAEEAEALRQAGEEARQPFDLSRFPLLRASLWRLAADDHLLLVVFHHAITDDWSHGIFLRELFAFYGTPPALPALPDLPIQYGDFAAWQREWLTGETLELKLMPWRRRLEGAPDTLELPTDRPRTRAVDAAAGTIRVSLPAPLFAALQETARAHGATMFMVLLAGLQAVLARHGGQDDLLVGCPVANRNRLETEDLIGFFTNTLVLRGDLRDDPTFGTFLARVREVAVEAFANEDLPFEKLVEDLSPARRLDQNPLFQVMFAFHRAELPSAPLPGLALEPAEVFAGAAKVDLSLNLAESPGGVAGIWEYSTALFDRTTALRISERWLTLLADAAHAADTHPDRRVSELELLPDSERHQVVTEWSWTRPATSREILVHQIFERQADQTPDAPAAVFADASLTYRELESRANRLANHLRNLGLQPDALVGLCVERSLDLPVAVLGVLKAGAAYVPLDPEYPAERLALMAADAGLAALVTHEALAGRVPVPSGLPVVRLDADRDVLAAESGERPDSGATRSNLAYVIYTSGSTGRPKGIAMPHRALVNIVDWRLAGLALPPGAVTLQFSSLSFDASFYEIFPAWGSAGTLALITEDVRRDPVELLRYLDRYGVHRLYLPFIALQMLARAAEPPRRGPRALREVLSAGEQLQITPQVRGFFAQLPECRLENHYGPSETHVITWLRLGPDAAEWPAVPGIGRAIEGTWIHLVDRRLRPVPIGVPGELLAGGVGLARGYAGRPDLTAERFVPNPFADPTDTLDASTDHGPGSRLYRTGDLARTLPDGSLELLGRIDSQVKVRGVRLEPAEIEAALAEHPAVAECAVVARRLGAAGMGDLALFAYAAPKPGAAPATRQLREFLAGKLPDAAVPSFFVTVPALPRTPSGKVDRKALPSPGAEAAGEGFVAPRTPTEEVLAGIWQEVLRIDRSVTGMTGIGAYDSFFDLGGHSLTAMSVTSQVRPLFHVDLPTRTIFETPVLAHLAERIDRLVQAQEGLELPPLRRWERGAEAPLSFAQQRLWFADVLAGGQSPFYNVGAPRELRGPLDPGALARAFGEIVRRHEALRTTFRMDADGRAVQVVHPPVAPALPEIDLTGLPAGRAAEVATSLLEQDAVRPFDLTAGPLLRTLLVRLGDERHFLGTTLHHIVFDGWSLGVLDRELAALYGAFLAGEAPRLPELPVQYADYALWQRSWLEAGATREKQLGFWRGQLDGAPRLLELPTDRPRPAVQRYEGGAVLRELPETLARGLEELARHHQVTPFMVLLAAFATLLSRHGGQDDLLVGSPLASRDRAEVEGLIGFFVNLLVLRVDLSGEPTFEQLLARVRDTALHAYAHQDLPFEALVDELHPERNLSTNPLLQAVLSLQDGGQGMGPAAAGPELPGLASRPFGFDRQHALFDLTLVVRRTRTAEGTGLTAILNFKRSLFDLTTLARMLDELQRLLEAAVAAPATPVAALPLWSEAARHQVLREWNDSRADFPRDVGASTVDRLFARAAERTPDALAVTGPDGRLTYAELEERANRLAHHLRRRGVRLESRVALCLDRSVDLVVATVAVLRAGGAYLPIDPAAPEQRLAWMVEDSGAAVVVTRERWAGRLGAAPLLLLDDRAGDAEEIAAEPAVAPASGHGPRNLAYVIYTSGSTGRPKGVAVEHRALLDHVVWYRRRYGVTAADRLGATSSPLFDPTVTETWTALTAGAALCVPPSAIVPVAGELLDWLAAERVTHCFLPTVLAPAFLEHSRQAPAGLALRFFTTGGDRCPRPPAGLPYRFEDWYGPTETTVAATVTAMTPESPPNIGRPVDNAEVVLLDRHQRPVPPGGAGEICIGGAGLSRGYLGRPDLTAERYIPHPFADPAGARLYRSGDRGRFRADGVLEFLGRTDFQVKMRRFPIELGEVESVLGQHPGVRESAVVMRELAPGDFGLAAYYAPRPEDTAPGPGPDELRAWLGERLPDYMVPAAIVRLEALPRTLTGKLDRAALPAPELGTAAAAYVAPRTPTEEALAALWQELLGVERVGAEDHFFLLGGHSLLAVGLAARIRDRFRVSLSMPVVFEEPVLAGLAAAVDRAVASGEPAEESPALVAGARRVRTPKGPRA